VSKKIFLSGVAIFMYFLCGCAAPLIVGATGAGVTYNVTADSVTDTVNAPKEVVIERFINIIKSKNGKITYASISEGEVRGEIGEKYLYLNIKDEDKNRSKFTLRARKTSSLLPDKEMAIETYTELVKGIK
jgi:hypothetical protein